MSLLMSVLLLTLDGNGSNVLCKAGFKVVLLVLHCCFLHPFLACAVALWLLVPRWRGRTLVLPGLLVPYRSFSACLLFVSDSSSFYFQCIDWLFISFIAFSLYCCRSLSSWGPVIEIVELLLYGDVYVGICSARYCLFVVLISSNLQVQNECFSIISNLGYCMGRFVVFLHIFNYMWIFLYGHHSFHFPMTFSINLRGKGSRVLGYWVSVELGDIIL